MSDEPQHFADLLRRVSQRDEGAAKRLVEHLYPLVCRIVHAHRPREMAAEDLSQEVFMNVFAHLHQFRGSVPFEHWVSRIAVNTCIDHLRRKRVRPELRWADLDEPRVAALEATLCATEEPSRHQAEYARELVALLLARLDPQDRLIIQWLELEERTVREISTLTGWSQTRVKVRAFRARRKLRNALEAYANKEI